MGSTIGPLSWSSPMTLQCRVVTRYPLKFAAAKWRVLRIHGMKAICSWHLVTGKSTLHLDWISMEVLETGPAETASTISMECSFIHHVREGTSRWLQGVYLIYLRVWLRI